MEKYFTPPVLVALLRTSSTLVFARALSLASEYRCKGSSGSPSYEVKARLGTWRLIERGRVPARDEEPDIRRSPDVDSIGVMQASPRPLQIRRR